MQDQKAKDMATAAEAVRRGAGLLDEHKPGWDSMVDIAQLDITRGKKCVLGQLYGDYGTGLGILGIRSKPVEHGFCADYSVGEFDTFDANLRNLTALWREEIALRRLANAPKPAVVTQ